MLVAFSLSRFLWRNGSVGVWCELTFWSRWSEFEKKKKTLKLKCRRGSGTMRATLCICRWLRVKRARSAAPWARRPPRTAAGPTSTSPSTRTCSFISRTIRVRDPPGFTCWRDARASGHRRPKSPPSARSQWRSSRWVPAAAAAAGDVKMSDARC